VQAPKARSEARSPAERRTFLYVALFGASGLIILGGVLGFVAFGSSGGGSSTAATGTKRYSENCVEKSYPGLPPRHLQSPDAKVKYDSFPPSSGPHYQTPAPWNIYDEPIQQTILVHNLEHGGIIIQYGDVPEDQISQLRDFYQSDPNGLVVAPFPQLGKIFALTAWNAPAYTEGKFKDVDPGKGYVLRCKAFDEKAFAKFRDERRGKAGERIPVSSLTPGA